MQEIETQETNQNCFLNGNEITNGTTIQAFKEASVPLGTSCVSKNRTCNN
jgi:hypothetical protein